MLLRRSQLPESTMREQMTDRAQKKSVDPAHIGNSVQDQQTPHVTGQALMLHPRFPEAVRNHVQISLFLCKAEPFAREFFGDGARQLVFFYIAVLSARSSSEPLLTPTRLLQALKPWGFSHHGKIDALVKRLIDHGLLIKRRHEDDRRVVVMQPTETFFVLFDKLVTPHLIPAALVVDDAILAKLLSEARSGSERYAAFGAFRLESGLEQLQRVPQMWAFLQHDCGWLILFVLMEAVWRKDAAAQRSNSIAAVLGVSRSHVKNVLNSAFELGLLEETSPGLLAPTDELLNVVDLWVAECLAAVINFIYREQEA